MASLEVISFAATIAGVGLSVILGITTLAARRLRPASAMSTTPSTIFISERWDYAGWGLTALSLLLLTVSIVSRALSTGHGPFSNMYEFSLAFAWGILAMSLLFRWRYRLQILITSGAAIALALLLFASILPSKPVPLVPALQQSFLLSAHVAAAIVAYGAFTMGFCASALYLIKDRWQTSAIPGLEVLDDMGYLSVKIGFPFMTLLIILGALWADIAWGTYWSWDPKETASLVTWLLFASYLHARLLGGWHGRRAAWILIAGFAAVLFTFFGNYIFSGLHSYR